MSDTPRPSGDRPEPPWTEGDGPVFKAPWEAYAFAMTVRLFEEGHFTWQEWTDTLSAEIAEARRRGEADTGERYYEYWLKALETIVVAKGLGTVEQLGALKDGWTKATLATPHGQPIELKKPIPLD